ncbi:MAG: DUF4870 domain-containing protein, partial [Patescibacteria group bacterium]
INYQNYMPEKKSSKTGASTVAKATAVNSKDVEENKYIAAIGYIFILCFVPLFMAKESKFAQFHAKQALVLFIIEVAFSIVDVVLIFIPIIGWFTIVALWIAIVVVAVMAFFRALAGESWEIPVIADWVKKLNL